MQLPVPRSQMALLEKLYLQTGSLIPWLLPKGGGRGKQEVFQCDGVNQLSPAHSGIFTLFLYHVLNIAWMNESMGRFQLRQKKKVCHISKKQYILKCTSINCITQSLFPNEICRYVVVNNWKQSFYFAGFTFDLKFHILPTQITGKKKQTLCTSQCYDYILLCIFNF